MSILVILLSLLSIVLLIHNTALKKRNDLLNYTVGVLAGYVFEEHGEEYLKKLTKY